jgi:hypothetical protein
MEGSWTITPRRDHHRLNEGLRTLATLIHSLTEPPSLLTEADTFPNTLRYNTAILRSYRHCLLSNLQPETPANMAHDENHELKNGLRSFIFPQHNQNAQYKLSLVYYIRWQLS